MSTDDPTIIPQDGQPPLVINLDSDQLVGMLDDLLARIETRTNANLDARVAQLRKWSDGLIDIARDALDEGLPYNIVAANIITILRKELRGSQLAEVVAILTLDTAERQRKDRPAS